MTPYISIIIPVYNTEKVLKRCIDSILSQTVNNFEVILVDDGSTDSSGEICDLYKERYPNIKAIHKKNGGVSSARNAGIKQSIGNWIAFVDSDDYVDEDFVEKFYQAIITTDSEIIVQGYHVEGGSDVLYCPSELGFARSLSCLKEKQMEIVVWNMAFKRVLINSEKPFDERYSFREDEGFVLNMMSSANKILFTNTIAYHYFAPNWGEKYVNDNLQAQEFWDLISCYDDISIQTIAIYATQYADATLNSIKKSDDIRAYITMRRKLSGHRTILHNKTARISLIFSPLIGYLICRVLLIFNDWRFLRQHRQ